MPIRIEDLPLPYQQQAAKKALGMVREQQKKKQKYHNEREDWNRIKFDSRAELRRYQQLMAMLEAGEIAELRIHPEFTLIEAYTKPDGKRVRRMRYTADFSYRDATSGKLVVEDVKSRPTRTTDYQMRKKLMLDRYGIEVQEIT